MGTAPGDLAYYGIEAGASVQANGTVNHQRDCVVAGPAASIYSYTLSRELPGGAAGLPGLLIAQVTEAGGGEISVNNLSNLVKQVSTFTLAMGNAAADRAHSFIAMRLLSS